jgi:hypothetical protein
MEEQNEKELDKLNTQLSKKREQPDPYNTNKKLYNPSTGDLYITITDKNGNTRRQVINLMGD